MPELATGLARSVTQWPASSVSAIGKVCAARASAPPLRRAMSDSSVGDVTHSALTASLATSSFSSSLHLFALDFDCARSHSYEKKEISRRRSNSGLLFSALDAPGSPSGLGACGKRAYGCSQHSFSGAL